MKLHLYFIAFVLSLPTLGQELQLFAPNSQWILETSKIEKKELRFIPYSKEAVDLNTMVWTFLPGGFIEYDYQTNEDIFACAGVDFLDLDLSECRWQYNAATRTLTLQLKGGYASIDDFVFKRDYLVGIEDVGDSYAYVLRKSVEYFFNDLTK